MNKRRQILTAAICASFVLVFTLMAIIYSATIGPRSNLVSICQFAALLTMTAVAIVWWGRYLKVYVDFAVERKLSEIGKQHG